MSTNRTDERMRRRARAWLGASLLWVAGCKHEPATVCPSEDARAPALGSAAPVASACACADGGAMTQDPAASETMGAWSPAVGGLRGRWIAKAVKDSRGTPQLRLDVELENVTGVAGPIEIWWGDFGETLRLTLEDEAGVDQKQPSLMAGSVMVSAPFWLPVTGNAMRICVTKGAYEYPQPGHKVLRPVAFQSWDIPIERTGHLYLRGRLRPAHSPPGGHRSWSGALELPRVLVP